MIERLRTLSSPLRYLVYAAGALLVLFVAVGVGATAAVVVGWQFERVATGPTKASEDTAIEPSNDSDDAANEASFVHNTTDENSRGDYTYISDPSINGDPNAVVLVSPTSDRKGTGGASYNHNIGIWYEPGAREWAIFNQDRAPVRAGATFEVRVPQASAGFVHQADLLNTAGNYTYLDNR